MIFTLRPASLLWRFIIWRALSRVPGISLDSLSRISIKFWANLKDSLIRILWRTVWLGLTCSRTQCCRRSLPRSRRTWGPGVRAQYFANDFVSKIVDYSAKAPIVKYSPCLGPLGARAAAAGELTVPAAAGHGVDHARARHRVGEGRLLGSWNRSGLLLGKLTYHLV